MSAESYHPSPLCRGVLATDAGLGGGQDLRKLLNTLYVTIPEAYLACEGENILIKADDEIKFRVPVHNLEGIVCFNFTGASPKLMQLCCERGVSLSFLSEYGKFLARVTGKVSGNILLRKNQYADG